MTFKMKFVIYIYIYIYIHIFPPHNHHSCSMTIYANRVHKVLFADKVICVSQALKLSLSHYVDTRESILHCPLERAPFNMFEKI